MHYHVGGWFLDGPMQVELYILGKVNIVSSTLYMYGARGASGAPINCIKGAK